LPEKLAPVICLLLLATASRATVQTGSPAIPASVSAQASTIQQLSPAAAYQEAMHPVEVTRSSITNWSDIEQASLAVAIKRAADACAVRPASSYIDDPLVDLARLCALGQASPAVILATDRYIHEDTQPKPRLAEAYAAQIEAQLHLKDEPAAFKSTQAMLAAVPYTSLVANASTEAINYTQLLFTADAVSIAMTRQPRVLALLRVASTPGALVSASPTDPLAVELYRQALTLAELQQLEAKSAEALQTTAALDAVVPATLPDDDKLAIAAMRQRYAQLGQPLATITPLSALDRPHHILPYIPAHSAITALLLFPDWCAHCVRLAHQMPETVFTVQNHEAYIYGLLAQTVPPEKIPLPTSRTAPTQQTSFNPAYAAEYLKGTPTVTVAPGLLDTFHATDVPLLILTDSHGIVRLIEAVDENALQPGNTLDSAVALIGHRWPTTIPAGPALLH